MRSAARCTVADQRTLVLQHPAPRSSRGRNGPFTATSLELYARTGHTPEERGFLSIDASSRREAKEAPAIIGLSLEDAVVLAEQILEAVRQTTGVSGQGHPTAEALLKRALPYLVLLGDYIGNGPANDPEGRCALIAAIQDCVGNQRLYRAGHEATEGPDARTA